MSASEERDKLELARLELAAWITKPRAGAPPPIEPARAVLSALEAAEAELADVMKSYQEMGEAWRDKEVENEALRAELDRLREGSIAALLPLRENPFDSLTIHYDAGEWSVELHEDAGRHVETGPQPSLLDAVQRALASGEESR